MSVNGSMCVYILTFDRLVRADIEEIPRGLRTHINPVGISQCQNTVHVEWERMCLRDTLGAFKIGILFIFLRRIAFFFFAFFLFKETCGCNCHVDTKRLSKQQLMSDLLPPMNA